MRLPLSYILRAPRAFFVAETPPGAGDPPPTDYGAVIKAATAQNPQLQAALDAVIDARLARAKRGAPPEVDVDAITNELKAAKNKLAEIDRKNAEAAGQWEIAKKSLIDEFSTERTTFKQREEALLGTIKQDRISNALISAAAAANAVDPDDIADLLGKRVILDKDLNVRVLDEHGNTWMKGGEPVTPKQLVAWHKQQKPWLYKAAEERKGDNDGDGAGSGGGDGDAGKPGTKNGVTQADLDTAKQALDDARAAHAANPSDATLDLSIRARKKLEALIAKASGKGK